jgi:hypothetical protein
VGRPSTPIHVLTLLLTALLAWPWNVVLSTAESSQIALQARLGAVHAPETSQVLRVVHSRWWEQQSCSVIAPDFDRDEEEGDDGGPVSPTSGLLTFLTFPTPDLPACTLTSLVLPAPTAARERLCRLRC